MTRTPTRLQLLNVYFFKIILKMKKKNFNLKLINIVACLKIFSKDSCKRKEERLFFFVNLYKKKLLINFIFRFSYKNELKKRPLLRQENQQTTQTLSSPLPQHK